MRRLAYFVAPLITLICTAWTEEGSLILPVMETHCVKCHGKEGKIKGKVNLLEIGSIADLESKPELLEKLIEVIDFEEMPPEEEPQVEPSARTAFLKQLKASLNRSVSAEESFAHTPMRRMNRFQYDNAVVDLFQLQGVVFSLPERMMREHGNYFKPETGKMAENVTVGSRPLGKSQMIEKRLGGVAAFPQDLRAEHGYDNQADHLSLSPLLMESFLKLGQSVVDSKDFVPETVGIWPDFFAAPASEEDVESVVRRRLEQFLFRAFRRPVDQPLVDRYANFVIGTIAEGTPFTEAMKAAASAVISSPRFLYLYDESTAEERVERVSDSELASRMSFFLWGSIPDQTLLDLAQAGELSKPDVLDAQFTRMLKDHKLKRFCDSFPSQWLQLERIISSRPNRDKFPDFYFLKYRDSMHMMLEPLLIFETVLIENQSILQLIDSDFTYRSALLQEAYGELAIDGFKNKGTEVAVLNFHRLPVTDRRNGGVITNAAVMTMTSGPERTQPITRGAWVAGVVFNNPPEPPPANVPVLGEKPPAGQEHLTLRERLAIHRERADCRGCHEQIDPLGFALENFDPIGNWRNQYENGRQIDMEGTCFVSIPSVVSLSSKMPFWPRKIVLPAVCGHLLSFALARELGPADQMALDTIASRTREDDYRIQTLLKEVILSEPFSTKTNSPEMTVLTSGH
ncbi:MAG: DUF1592 domain-containing protein [Verrucomicrobiales bacterium]